MLNIGCHLSSSKGYEAMGKTALSIGANTFQFFTRNPRGGKMKPINLDDIEALNKIIGENSFAPIIAHAPYTLNPCALDESLRDFARDVFREDLKILENISGAMYNFHPGSHVKQGVDVGIEKIAEILNDVLSIEQKNIVLLETMAGKGSEVGRSFEEIRAIINEVEFCDKIGVCLDTCHIWDSGYDIKNKLEYVLSEFDNIIGLERLKAIHLNDSINTLGSHKDRHACIGKGCIGVETIVRIINHPKLRNLPFYLETPNELSGYADEIKLLREKYVEK